MVSHIEGTANNPLLANALADSVGRDAYLRPYFGAIEKIGELPVHMVLRDFQGQPIAASPGKELLAVSTKLVQGVISSGEPQVDLQSLGGDVVMTMVWPVVYPNTGQPEGALTYQFSLGTVFDILVLSQGCRVTTTGLPDGVIQELRGEQPPTGAIVRTNVITPPAMLERYPIKFEVWLNAEPLKRDLLYLALGLTALVVLAIAVIVPACLVLTRRLLARLHRLERAAQSVMDTGSLRPDFLVEGDDEIASLGRVFDQMLGELEAAREEQMGEANRIIRSQSELLTRILANTCDGFAVVDCATRFVTLANTAFLVMLQLDQVVDAQFPAPEILAPLIDKGALTEAPSACSEALEIRTGKGRTITVIAQCIVAHAENGNKELVLFLTDITERKLAEEALLHQKMMLSRTEAIAHIGSWEWDMTTDTVMWSEELFRIFELDPSRGAPPFAQQRQLYQPESLERLRKVAEAAQNDGSPFELELEIIRPHGENRHCLGRGYAEKGPDGMVARLFGSLQDITERKQAEAALREAEKRYRELVEFAPLGIFQSTPQGRYISANTRLAQIYGYDSRQDLIEGVQDISGQLYVDQNERDTRTQGLDTDAATEGRRRRKDGSIIWVSLFKRAVCDESGAILRYEGFVSDITTRKQAEAALAESNRKLEALSHTDGLTGIANRRYFDEMLVQEHGRHVRSGGHLSLILLDIDYFKAFNDLYGHVMGDECLRQVALVIAESASRPADLAARYGGEEFVCILPETGTVGAIAIAQKIRMAIQALATPHAGSHVSDHITASLGIVTVRCTINGSVEDIVKQADAMLYLAKSSGRNQVKFGPVREA